MSCLLLWVLSWLFLLSYRCNFPPFSHISATSNVFYVMLGKYIISKWENSFHQVKISLKFSCFLLVPECYFHTLFLSSDLKLTFLRHSIPLFLLSPSASFIRYCSSNRLPQLPPSYLLFNFGDIFLILKVSFFLPLPLSHQLSYILEEATARFNSHSFSLYVILPPIILYKWFFQDYF